MKLALASVMRLTIGPSLLAIALLAGAAVAFFPRAGTAAATREASAAPKPIETSPPGAEAFNAMAPSTGALPPNHPSIGAQGDRPDHRFAATDDAPALTWTPPAGWELAPNRSTMRLATYRVPAAAKGGVGAELTVSRAGGTTDENLQRWVGQFDGSGKDTRALRTVAGFHVTTLDVSGSYDGGMSSTGPEAAHPGWSLLGAVVETTGPSYFFKMVGPSEAVHAASPLFEQLLNSVRKPG